MLFPKADGAGGPAFGAGACAEAEAVAQIGKEVKLRLFSE